MSYTVLARKYRSGNFDELIGQEHIARTLRKAIESGRIAHAYLFCGTRGTGKTSTARILAKCLNCETSDQPTPNPCGECASCKAIARGDDIDVIEIDAASNTGVDNVRDIIANAGYRPARSRFKVYIIDEVHMLSKAAFNALLKTLEEPPEHVKFILATTEPEKVLPTILSRCQRYDFRNIPTREIVGHLKTIAKSEKIDADEEALFLVAKAGAGSMRDSLSLLDRLLSVGEKTLSVEMIEQLLGLPRSQLIFDLAQAIGEAKVGEVLAQADRIIANGLAPDTLIASLIDHLRNLLIIRTCGADSTLVEVPGIALEDLQAQANQFDAIVLAQDIALLEELRRQLRTTQAGRALLDASLVRLALAEQFTQIGELLNATEGNSAPGAAPDALKKKRDEGVASSLTGSRSIESHSITSHPAEAGRANEPSALPISTGGAASNPPDTEDSDDDALPAVGKVWDNSGPSLSELLKARSESTASTPAPEPQSDPQPTPSADSNVEPVEVQDLPRVWQSMLDLLSARGPMLLSLVQPGQLTAIEDDLAVVRYEPRHETFVKMLERNGKKDLVRDALAQVTGRSLGLKFEIDAAAGEGASDAPEGIPSTKARPSPRPVKHDNLAPVGAAPPPAQPNVVRITPELVESLKSEEPLIRGLMDELGATIVKVEAS
jgi:DNA polymerase-3 subunit gamma/tau